MSSVSFTPTKVARRLMARTAFSSPLWALELRADAARRLARAICALQVFLRRDECEDILAWEWDPTCRLGEHLVAKANDFLNEALCETAPPPSEPTLRSAYRLIAALNNLAAWSAPATQESYALASFPVTAARDAVAYSRFGNKEIAEQEQAFASMLGFDPVSVRVLLTSSGMTAYALIESFLLREVLKSQDRILLHPNIYFETRQQITSLDGFSACTAADGSRDGILAAIVELGPRVVFVDPLSNSAEFRTIDMTRLLCEADKICEQETWFVVDGTLLSGAFDLTVTPRRKRVRVLYYESGCKYLQFGMDLGPAGLLVVEADLAERFEQLRRGTGAIAPETLVLPRASRQAYLTFLQTQTKCAQAVVRAATQLLSLTTQRVIEPVHPSQPHHSDHAETQAYVHLGGVLGFRFANAQMNRRQPLEDFIDYLISRARTTHIPLTAGVSFGFCVPRVGAAWSSYDADEAFLRLSAGIDFEIASALGQLIVQCANEFVAEAVRSRTPQVSSGSYCHG